MSRHSRSRTRRRNRGRFGPLFKLLCVVAVAVALTVGATVFFRVETVTVTGNQRYTQEEVIAASGIRAGDNLYALNKVRVSRNIRSSLPYIEKLSINRSLPNAILITVTEWEAVARIAVPDQDQITAAQQAAAGDSSQLPALEAAREPWLISKNGKLLEPAPADSDVLLVTGLTPIAPQAGSFLEVPESETVRLEALTGLLQALEEAEFQASSIRLETTRLTMRYLDRFDVKMGLGDDFTYDLRLTLAVQAQMEEQQGSQVAGSIDLTQSGHDAVFSPAE